MSIFSFKRKRANPHKSPLLLKVEEIDAKLDQLSGLLAQVAASKPAVPTSIPVQQPMYSSHEQGFAPFEPFAETAQEGGDGNG